MDQVSIQLDKLVTQARGLKQAVEDACKRILELAMLVELPAAK